MATNDQDFVLLGASDIQDFNQEGILPLSDVELDKIQSWLAPTDYKASSGEYGKHCSSRLPGTGSWLLTTDEYQQWHHGDKGGLWIKAIPGAGKSVIAASIISELLTDGRTPVLYFFFRHIVSANQTPQSLIRDYMSQLLEYSPHLQRRLHTFVQDRRSLDSISIADMWDTLVTALVQIPLVYCVVDALDEMDKDHAFFLEYLAILGQQKPTSIKLLMTSRPVPQVEKVLREPSVIQIALQSQLIDPDISTYVRHRLQASSLSTQARTDVYNVMCSKSSGQFLYARLMMDDLLDSANSGEDLKSALEQLPQPMTGMYTQMLLDHSQRSGVPQELQLLLLQCVTRVERPIRLLELAAMVGINYATSGTSRTTKNIVRDGCGPLLEILDDETVCPIHHSFTEYLYDQHRSSTQAGSSSFPVLDYHQAQRRLALMCLKYLCSGWHHDWHSRPKPKGRYPLSGSNTQQEIRKIQLKYPFLEYAANNWYKHILKSNAGDEPLVLAIDSLLVERQDLLSAWLEITETSKKLFDPRRNHLSAEWGPLQVAADKGIRFYVSHLIRTGHDIECSDDNDQTPLALAALAGSSGVVAVLLENGAGNNKPDTSGMTPLHHAASHGHRDVVKLLLESGVDPCTHRTRGNPRTYSVYIPTTVGDPPIRYACRNGHLETVKTFIPFLSDSSIRQALYWALQSGHTETAMTVLSTPGIDVNGGGDLPTPLYHACSARDIDVMRTLLSMGARADAQCHDRKDVNLLHALVDPLLTTVRDRLLDTDRLAQGVKLLLSAGQDPNIQDASGYLVLHHVVRQDLKWKPSSKERLSTDEALMLLLKGGSDARALSRDGSNVLHFAQDITTSGVDTLIKYGVDVNQACKSNGKTPLMQLIVKNDMLLVKHLLKRGADIRIPDHNGDTPLHAIARSYDCEINLDMVEVLIEAGADINDRNRAGDTILHFGIFKPKLLACALAHGFNVEVKNQLGHSILHEAILRGSRENENVYQSLIEAGARVLTYDSRGANILHSLVGKGIKNRCVDMMRYCVEQGVNPLELDGPGETLWHKLATTRSYQQEQSAILELLVEWNVPALANDHKGRSPLHIAVSTQEQWKLINYFIQEADVSVNVADLELVRPIHLASSWNTEYVCLLLDLGSDPVVVTLEGQTPLMIACRNQQCNTVSVLLRHYQIHDQVDVINYTDVKGRTALHYACKSGRPEAVDMLLRAGADANVQDDLSYTPLRMCAEYLVEQSWVKRSCYGLHSPVRSEVWNKTGYIALTDIFRPDPSQYSADPLRVRESIRLLIEHGAHIAFPVTISDWQQGSRSHLPLVAAIRQNCTAMVSELFDVMDSSSKDYTTATEQVAAKKEDASQSGIQDSQQITPHYERLLKSYEIKARTNLPALQTMSDTVAQNLVAGEDNVKFITQLLEDEDEPAVREASTLGANFAKLNNRGDSAIIKMVAWGFTDLVKQVGQDAAKTIVAQTYDTAKMAPQSSNWSTDQRKSILHVALSRETPNLRMVKLLVSELNMDVHEQYLSRSDLTQSHLHFLARPDYWWQTEALELILDGGADTEMRNSEHDTPLMVALRSKGGNRISHFDKRAVRVLLEHGANPNAMDKSGETCLNIAAAHPDLVKLLLKHGADPARGPRPFLFDVIKTQAVDVLRSMVDSGIDANVLASPVTTNDSSFRSLHSKLDEPAEPKKWADIHNVYQLMSRAYPIHIAACVFLTTPENLGIANTMVELLLEAGADPFKVYADGTPVAHVLAEYGHVIEPLIKHPAFDMEARDIHGRTILLAACDAHPSLHRSGVPSRVSLLLESGAAPGATDLRGRNALHCLIAAHKSWGSPMEMPTQLQSIASSLVSQPDHCGQTPFHYALENLRFELIDQFISYGADFSAPDPVSKQIALHHLARDLANDTDMILHNRNELRHTIKQRKYVFGLFTGGTFDPQRVSAKIDASEAEILDPTETSQAYLRSPRCHFQNLLKRGLSINARDSEGETPLFKVMTTPFYRYEAATTPPQDNQNQHTGRDVQPDNLILKLFSSLGADFQARSATGQSILHRLAAVSRPMPSMFQPQATASGMEESLQRAFMWIVKEKGVDVRWEDDEGRTCLDVAAAVDAKWVLDMYKSKRE